MDALAPQDAAYIAPIHIRQIHIQKNGVEIGLFSSEDRGFAGARLLYVEFLVQTKLLRQRLAKISVVLDEQYVPALVGCHPGPLHRLWKRLSLYRTI